MRDLPNVFGVGFLLIPWILFGAATTAFAEDYCYTLSSYAGAIVEQRDAGEPYTVAIADLVGALAAHSCYHDTVLDTIIAVDMVERAYTTPPPTVEQVAASIKARCLSGMTAPPSPPPLVQRRLPTQSRSLFQQDLADRKAWETWEGGLAGEYRSGAEYWAGHRSLPNLKSCYNAGQQNSSEWISGCVEALDRLAASDLWRKLEPEYRSGWNSFTPLPTSGTTSPEKPQILSSPSDARWFGVAHQKDCLPIEAGGYGPLHTPDQVLSKLNAQPGQFWVVTHPSQRSAVPSSDVAVLSAVGAPMQIILVRGHSNCLEVVRELEH